MPHVETAIFDFDGTVADTLPLIYEAYDAALTGPLGRRLSDREVRAQFGPPDHEIIRSVLAEKQEHVEAASARYLDFYEREHDRLAKIFDQMDALLHRCRDAGMKLGVVTGKSRRTALLSLQALRLADIFGVIIAGDDVADPKPHPEGVLAALGALGHEPGSPAAFIGDSAADVLAGLAAGMKTIAVTWGSPDLDELRAARPDIICDTVAELAVALGLDAIQSV